MATTSPILPRATDLTDRDFDSIRARIMRLIPSVFPEWSETSVANFGNILAELPAHVADVVLFYVDRAARESRITTAQLRRSLMGLCKLVGFDPSGPGAATVVETFTLAAATAGTFTLKAGQKVKTSDVTAPVSFQLLADLVFPPGTVTMTATVEHSETNTDSFASSGLPNQRFVLKKGPYLDGSLQVVAADGAYTVVRNFLNSTSTDKHVVVVVDSNNKGALRFGNGTNGAIPSGTINATYKTGGGSAGRLEPGRLNKIDGTFTDSLTNTVRVSCTNALKTTGAADRMSNAQIRLLAPESTRVQRRAVSREDYEIVANSTPGVARSLHLSKDEDAGIGENQGLLFLVPRGGGAPSQTLIDKVLARFADAGDYPKTNGYNLIGRSPNYLTVNVLARVYKRAGFLPATLKANVLAALAGFFAISVDDAGLPNDDGVPNPKIDFGWNLKDVDGNATDELAYSDLYDLVRNAAGVRKIGDNPGDFTLNSLSRGVTVPNFSFPVLGTVTIIDGDTGLVL